MNNLVIQWKNNNVTSSLQVAEIFGKEHKNILRDIINLDLDQLNFEQMFFETEMPDSYNRMRKAYYMNRDGFTLLAMGFTGKEAMKFKLDYINEFNKMEEALKPKLPTTYKEALLLLVEAEEEKEKLQLENNEMKPKVTYHDNILNNESTMKITQIAKDYGMSGAKMNNLLHSMGIQYKQGKTWVLYAKYSNEGYTHSRSYEDHSPSTYWTEKGKKFIYEKLRNIDVLPLIEGGAGGVKIYQS